MSIVRHASLGTPSRRHPLARRVSPAASAAQLMAPAAPSASAAPGNAQHGKTAEDGAQRSHTLLLAAAVLAVLSLLAAAAATARPLFLVRPPITRRTSGVFQFSGDDCTRALARGEWTDDFVSVRCTNDTAAEFATCGDMPRRHWRFSAAAAACGARRRTAAEAREQLAGRRVTFAGDSITRTLYAAALRLLSHPAQAIPLGHLDFQHDLGGGVALAFRWAPYPDNLTALLAAGELGGHAAPGGGERAAGGLDGGAGAGRQGAAGTPAEEAVEEGEGVAEAVASGVEETEEAPAAADGAGEAAGGPVREPQGSRRRHLLRRRRVRQAPEQPEGDVEGGGRTPPPAALQQQQEPPALLVMSATLWHLLHVTAADDFAARLRRLGAAAGALLGSGAAGGQPADVHAFLASGGEMFPNRMRALDKRQSMTPANLDAYNAAMQEAGLLAPGGPLALLDLLPLTLSCGEECSIDGVHSQPEVCDAALQLLLSLDAWRAAESAAGGGGEAQRRDGGR